MKVIEIIVKHDGETTVETKGFSGSSCKEASRFIEEALGQRQQERLTTEFSLVSEYQRIRNRQ